MEEPINKRKVAMPLRVVMLLLCGLASVAGRADVGAGIGDEAGVEQPPISAAEQTLLDLTAAPETLLRSPGSRALTRRAVDMRGRPIDIVGQHDWRMQQLLRRQGLRGAPVIEVR